jgi:hypothetical protein
MVKEFIVYAQTMQMKYKFSQCGLMGVLGIGLGKWGKLEGIKLPCSQNRIALI